MRDNWMRILSVLIFVVAGALWGQSGRGVILGTVTDQSGAVIPGAEVQLRNESTNVSSTTETNEMGDYRFSDVEPGSYTITVTGQGFRTSTMSHITLRVAQTARVDVKLEVGEVTETVEVTASQPIVQSETSSVGDVVDGKQIAQMPLDGRANIYSLMALAPGVQRAGSNPLISGGTWVGATNMTVDGVPNTDVGNGRLLATVPSLEAVSEFKVIANAASAEYGYGGAQVVMVTKSGTNEFHGSLVYFNRNKVTAARDFFARTAPPYNRNEFGGSIGGPILRDKLFFFGSYEGLRLRQYRTNVTRMPTEALKKGDLAGLTGVIDPFTGAPFPNNQIPPDRISPISQELQKFTSTPNLPGTGPAGLGNNYVVNIPRKEPNDRYSGRLDYNITPADRLTGRFYIVENGPFFSPRGSATEKFGNWGGRGIATRNVGVSYVRLITPSMINELRFGYNRERDFRNPQNKDFDPSQLIPGLTPPAEGLGGLPTVKITGFTGFHDAPGSGDLKHTYQIADVLSWTKGSHALKFGFDYRNLRARNWQNPKPWRGGFNFDGRYSGNAYVDFLLGYPSLTSRASRPVNNGPGNSMYSAFVQDDWKVTGRLTLNLGLRYEYATLMVNDPGDMANFYPNIGKIVILKGAPDPRLMNLPVVDGKDVGLDTGNYINKDRNNFAPRFGFAFRPLGTARFVIRGSYGIYYNVIPGYNGYFFLGINPPFVGVETFEPEPGPLPSLTFDNAFPGSGDVPQSPGVWAVAADRRTGYQQQWNFTLEYELLPNTSVRASYVGNKGTKLFRTFNLNDPPPAPGQVQPRRPYQPFGGINYIDSGRNSITNQLQLSAIRRFARGFSFQIEYQLTKGLGEQIYGKHPLDNRNARLDRGNLDFIRRHYLAANYIWDLPFGRGKRYGGSVTGVADKLLSGWQLSGIVTLTSGEPFSASFTSRTLGLPSGRPDILHDPKLDNPTIERWFDVTAYAPVPPTDFRYGTAPRNNMFGPSFANWDVGVYKNTAISERVSLQFRAEFFNILNHPNFGLPRNNISTSTAGQISRTSGDPRSISFGLKLLF